MRRPLWRGRPGPPPPNRHDVAVRAPTTVATLAGLRSGSPRRRRRRRRDRRAGRGPRAASAGRADRRWAPGTLDSPAGIALDAAGDLFVADTGHCRVLVVPGRVRGRSYGLHAAGAAAPRPSPAALRGPGLDRPPERRGRRRAAATSTSPRPTAQRVSRCVGRPAPPRRRRHGRRHGTGGLQRGRPGRAGQRARRADRRRGRPRRRRLHRRHRQLQGAGRAGGERHAPRPGGDRRATSTPSPAPACAARAGQGGPVGGARSCANPVAVAVDVAGDLLVADSGDQSVLLAPRTRRDVLRHAVGAGDHRRGRGRDGELRAVPRRRAVRHGPTAELNDPAGLAVGPTGALFVTRRRSCTSSGWCPRRRARCSAGP